MNHNTTDTFQKFTKRKTHESDNLAGRKGRKKDCYSTQRA